MHTGCLHSFVGRDKLHLDGYNFLPHLTGKQTEGPRYEFLYFSDDALLTGVRVNRWKFVFAAQRARQQAVWREPFVELRLPLIFDLRMDPYERAEEDSNVYNHWRTSYRALKTSLHVKDPSRIALINLLT